MHVLLEHISGPRKEEVIGNSQHAFTKGESCLTDLIAFCNKTTGFVDGARAVDIIYLDFCKAFDTVYHDLVSKLGHYGLDGWTTTWVKNCSDDRARRTAVNGLYSIWRPVRSGVP